jgi:hypothetical protein
MDNPETQTEWRDAFYVTTWRDPQALRDPHLKPRGMKRHGPFATYRDAQLYGQQINCTHFSIDKVFVAPNIHPPFLDHTGVRKQDPIPGIIAGN